MNQQLLLNPPKVSLKYFESRLISDGVDLIAGVDEAGRGCLAGPVVAASVILPENFSITDLRDSKQLTAEQRDFFYGLILKESLAWSVSIIEPGIIDKINILQASLLAMKEAVSKLCIKPKYLLVDGPFPVDINLPQKTLKKGDARSISIAAASIIAKVTRDRMMVEFERRYPGFSFSVHKGYGTELHMKELKAHGPTPIHRMTFAPLCHNSISLNGRG
jgi:ribonuclease HII